LLETGGQHVDFCITLQAVFAIAYGYAEVPWESVLGQHPYAAEAWTIEDGMPSTGFTVTGATNTSTTWSFDDAFSDGVGILAFHRFLFKIDDTKKKKSLSIAAYWYR
jgi:hypothetical protein